MSTQKGNILLPIISAVALIAIVAAGYFFWQNQQYQGEALGPYTPTTTPSPVPTTQNETVNWKSYKNNKLNYEFSYPNDFKIYEESPDRVFISNNLGTPGLSIYFDHIVVPGLPSEDSMSLDEYAKSRLASSQIDNNNQTTIQNIQKFGQDARFFEGIDEGYSHHYMLKPNPNLSFSVIANFPSKDEVPTYENLANQILSTFKFTK